MLQMQKFDETDLLDFTPAYRQILPVEKAFVDTYLNKMETTAVKRGCSLYDVMRETPPDDLDDRIKAMLMKPLVRAAIAERVRDITEDMQLSAYRVLKEVQTIALSNINDYMEIGEDGIPTPSFDKCTPEQMAAVKSIELEVSPRGGRKFKFTLHDKIGSLGNLMKYMGLLESDNPHYAQNAVTRPGQKTIAASSSEQVAADIYARHLQSSG